MNKSQDFRCDLTSLKQLLELHPKGTHFCATAKESGFALNAEFLTEFISAYELLENKCEFLDKKIEKIIDISMRYAESHTVPISKVDTSETKEDFEKEMTEAVAYIVSDLPDKYKRKWDYDYARFVAEKGANWAYEYCKKGFK